MYVKKIIVLDNEDGVTVSAAEVSLSNILNIMLCLDKWENRFIADAGFDLFCYRKWQNKQLFLLESVWHFLLGIYMSKEILTIPCKTLDQLWTVPLEQGFTILRSIGFLPSWVVNNIHLASQV